MCLVWIIVMDRCLYMQMVGTCNCIDCQLVTILCIPHVMHELPTIIAVTTLL